MVHVLLKPGLENFKHYFTRVWGECNCVVVWAFFVGPKIKWTGGMKMNVSPLTEVVSEPQGLVRVPLVVAAWLRQAGIRIWLSTQAWWPAPPCSALPMGMAGGVFPDGNCINCILQNFTHGNCHLWILKTQMGGACPFTFKSGRFCRTWQMVVVGVGVSWAQGVSPVSDTWMFMSLFM